MMSACRISKIASPAPRAASAGLGPHDCALCNDGWLTNARCDDLRNSLRKNLRALEGMIACGFLTWMARPAAAAPPYSFAIFRRLQGSPHRDLGQHDDAVPGAGVLHLWMVIVQMP